MKQNQKVAFLLINDGIGVFTIKLSLILTHLQVVSTSDFTAKQTEFDVLLYG